MIIVNKQLDELKDERGIVRFDDYAKAFPLLHYTDFDGNSIKVRDIFIEIKDGNIYVQTDINDVQKLMEAIKRELKSIYKIAQEHITGAQKSITAIEAVMGKAELCGEQEDEK